MVAINPCALWEMSLLRSHGCRGRQTGKCQVQGIGRKDTLLEQLRRHRRQRLCGANITSQAILRPVHRGLGFYRKEECQQTKRKSQRNTPEGKTIGERS